MLDFPVACTSKYNFSPFLKKKGKTVFEEILNTENPDLIAVVAYGKILPEYVLNYPKYGCINVHGSLLPKYRGAAPMQRAIMDGEKETGVTVMYMAEGLDTGDMLLIRECQIGENDNFEDIHDKLAECGAKLLVETVNGLEKGEITPTKQDDALATHAAKIEKEDCKIDFSLDGNNINIDVLEKVLDKNLKGYACKGKYINRNSVELIYDIRFRKQISNRIISELSEISGVDTVNIVSSNTDTMG